MIIPRRFFWLLDVLGLILAFVLAYNLVPTLQPLFAAGGPFHSEWLVELTSPALWSGQLPPPIDLAWILIAMTPVVLVVLGLTGNHGSLLQQSRMRVVIGCLLAPFVGLGVVTLILFALKNTEWSRLFIFSLTLVSAAVLCLYRLLLRLYFKRRQAAGYYAKNVLLIGRIDSIRWMTRYFGENIPTTVYRVVGYLRTSDARADTKDGAAADLGVRAWGVVERLGDLLITRPIHEVIAIHPTEGGKWIEQVVRDCDYTGVLLRIVPETLLTERHTLQALYPFEPLHLPAVALAPPHWDSEALFFKRLFDAVVSGLLLVLLAPLFALVAAAIKISAPHLPVFYRWRVVGQNGVEFTGYKFTTMVIDADERRAELLAHNEMNGPVFKMKDDPRVTPLGRFLRKYSLNELPQLWSVLKGDMSLVGPRPAFRHELERYEFWHKRKLSIKPGIPCLWQVRGRNRINNFDDWVRMDLEYIDNWSLWLDFKILLRTAWVVVAGTGS